MIRIPSRLDSSVIPVMPSIFLSLYQLGDLLNEPGLIYHDREAHVTIIRLLPLGMVSISVTARTRIFPRPVR